jgi:capsid protein
MPGVNFAGFRSAMLDAWRVFMIHRTWLGEDTCQPIYTMLMEEGFLRGELEADNFYLNIDAITHCDWRGSPKGDIEPIKAVQADVLAIQHNIKTRAEAIAERGGDLRGTFDQLQEEQDMMRERGLDEERVSPDTADKWAGDEKHSDQGTVDDMDGAGNEGM